MIELVMADCVDSCGCAESAFCFCFYFCVEAPKRDLSVQGIHPGHGQFGDTIRVDVHKIPVGTVPGPLTPREGAES